ncbi:MAG TPA: VCBS repeat-containing protein [Longimicrobiales bacterium]
MRRDFLKRSRHVRPRIGPALTRTALLTLTLALGLVACADEPMRPGAGGEEQEQGGRTPRGTLGLVEITISGLGTDQVTASALSAPTLEALERLRAGRDAGGPRGDAAPGGLARQALTLPQDSSGTTDGTIQLELLSTGSFTDGARGSGGYRYLWATYRVRNAREDSTAYDTERRNLTFYAVDTDGTNGTIGRTAISRLRLFDGSAVDPSLADAFVPTGAARIDRGSGAVVSELPDVLQVLTEAEADAIQALADSADLPVTDVFPYGFVVRNPSDPTSRTLPASPAEDQFDGIVTFAFEVPLQATAAQDPFTVSALFLAVDDDEVKITQSLEEQTPAGRMAFDARADALGADVLTLLAPAGDAVPQGGGTVRVLCDVRVVGPQGSPTATLSSTSDAWLLSSLSRSGSRYLPQDGRIAAARCPELLAPGPTTFAVHGFQSGRVGGAYDGVGSSLVRAPAAPGGDFFPGEEVEVTLTTDLGGTKPVVARYRVAATSGSGSFMAGIAYDVGMGPVSVALGDLNGDGDLDLVTANQTSHTVSVLLKKDDGSLDSDTAYGVGAGTGPVSVALGDLDGDGDLDLVTGNYTSNSVSVLLNGGGGSFDSPATYSVGGAPYAVALGDVDGDGDLDLATGNVGSNQILVLLNQGGGSFVLGNAYAVGDTPYSVALGDVDGDGDLDLAATKYFSGRVSVLVNQGGGSFVPGNTYVVGNGPQGVALGDVDGDGDLDLATANGGSGANVSVLLNDGDGTFGSLRTYVAGSYAESVALGDLDGDGDLDLVAMSAVSEIIPVLLNDGGGSFGFDEAYSIPDTPYSVALGDLDGDGALDLAVARYSSNTVAVFSNQ